MARIAERTSKTKSVKTSKPRQSVAAAKVEASASRREQAGFRLKRAYIIWSLAIILIIVLIYFLRSLIIAATVNGQPILRLAVVGELERQGGRQALSALVTKILIMQEAKKRNITVSQAEVDVELKRIESNIKQQGQTLDQALALQGMTKENLIERIRLQKMIEKIVGKDISVSDKEVADYIEKNKDAFPQEEDQKKLAAQVKDQLRQQKLNDKITAWIDSLRKNAKITSFVPYYP